MSRITDHDRLCAFSHRALLDRFFHSLLNLCFFHRAIPLPTLFRKSEDLFSARAPSTEGRFPMKCARSVARLIARISTLTQRKASLELGPKMGIDFSFSDEFRIDYTFTVPLNFIRPAMDLPIPNREPPRWE
jgi:hypothetical protein